jgi:hypothetical protein
MSVIIRVMAGEDVIKGDYLTVRYDGNVYRWKGGDEIRLAMAVEDAKAGAVLNVLMPFPTTGE